MTPSQPLTASTPKASTTRDPQPEGERLLRLWGELARHAACAAAHGTGDETSLLRQQLQLEETLAARYNGAGLLDELAVLDASLIHGPDQTPPEQCLICRRARLELPLALPFPAVRGGAR
ncbi:hypothetical protein [Angustibacter sp. Root456]|uniref:hypothetical protein n=1 Tax=Angustibacter sp. Root456 TaxID=1736539 RepID=UPI0006FABF22|nr:hypothetical protein [Angustibacter sp. Root456]KQX64500.1 hypothetical protein ASD06_10090 [Angustibacter sp. Root456]